MKRMRAASATHRPDFVMRKMVAWNKTAVFKAAVLALLFGLVATSASAQSANAQTINGSSTGNSLPSTTREQIAIIVADKANRNPAQQKMDSQLIYAARESQRTYAVQGVPQMHADVQRARDGRILVDIRALVSDALLQQIVGNGGQIVSNFPTLDSIRALMPPSAIEKIAARADVRFIRRAMKPINNRTAEQRIARARKAVAVPLANAEVDNVVDNVKAADIAVVAKTVSATASGATSATISDATTERKTGISAFRVSQILSRQIVANSGLTSVSRTNGGVATSQGDIAHRAAEARATYGIDGTGIKIGVLSDGIDSLRASVLSGDLPSDVTVLSGQGGQGDEGTAMMEIVHDLAPGAKLYFATADNGEASFAQNIRNLRAAGCDIIVDDVQYFDESPFQAGIIEQAVYDVSNSGALYFSSVSNSGNQDARTSSTWTGDFVDGGIAATSTYVKAGRLHSFGAATFDTVTDGGDLGISFFWSDPLNASTNDYDIYVTNSQGTVVSSSTTTQNGSQDPYEYIETLSAGQRVVIVQTSGASNRFLYISTLSGQLAISTAGYASGHNSAGADNAFSVAATEATGAPFSNNNRVEYFSSDGPRHLFYNPNGTPITPGNLSSSGGRLLIKPDVTAADGVSTSLPDFDLFYGTSAATPHAAAIAGLVLSYNRNLTPSQVRNALQSTALDIMAPGVDRDSGYGILTVPAAIASLASMTVAAPNANADAFNVNKNSSGALLPVLDNDSGDGALTLVSVTRAQHGVVQKNQNQVAYRPNTNFVGQDRFTYTIRDGRGATAVGVVTINVTAPERLVAYPQRVTTTKATPVVFTLFSSGGNGLPNLTYIIVARPQHGTLSGSGATRTYTPNPNFKGADSLSFRVSSGQKTSNIAKVTFSVVLRS